jgi:hypothetical protein
VVKSGIALILLVWAGIASAQISPDEALQKLHEREAATTRASDDPQLEIVFLKSVIADQATKIEGLKAQLAAMQRANQSVSEAKPTDENGGSPTKSIVQPKSTYESRAIKGHATASFIKQFKDLDAKIDAFSEQNHIDSAITASLHEGDPKVGMTEDEVRLIARLTPEVESSDGNIYKAQGFGESEAGWNHWKIATVSGVVTEIDKPDPYTGFFPDGTK